MTELVKNNSKSPSNKWISFRSELKVLDCTIRDGGLMNDHNFDDQVVKAVYNACVQSGIDYMELGYKADQKIFSRDQYGAWKFTTEKDMRRIVGKNETSLKLSTMADVGKTNYKTDILKKKDSVLDLIRVATYIHQIPGAIDMINDAHDKGYETSVNMLAISTVPEHELHAALALLMETPVETIYLVDSFGSLYSEQIQYLMKKYMNYANPVGKTIGMHAHNNMQLAYANTVETIVQGANMVDASMAGLGRGAGNCQMELLLGFLHNPKYKLRPVLECIRDVIEPMRKNLLWGPSIPYMITGLLNQHPRTAIRFMETGDRDDVVKFFDQILAED